MTSNMIASLSTGLPTAFMVGLVPICYTSEGPIVQGHAILLIVFPPAVKAFVNPEVPISVDINGHKINETGMILYDTADLVESNDLNFS